MVSCTSTSTSEVAIDKPQRLSIEELDLDWLDADITVDELEKNQTYIKKEISENGMYVTYEMENFSYVFTTDEEHWGESASSLLHVIIFGNNDGAMPGPRGIRVGDDFDSVMEKFPQDQPWKDNQEGVFYGMVSISDDPEFEKGSVTETKDGLPDFITLVPKGYPPYIKIHFENNHVIRMIIYYMMG
jgi:hypothetical protein